VKLELLLYDSPIATRWVHLMHILQNAPVHAVRLPVSPIDLLIEYCDGKRMSKAVYQGLSFRSVEVAPLYSLVPAANACVKDSLLSGSCARAKMRQGCFYL